MQDEEFTWADATELARLVRAGEVKPSELVEDAIGRIETLNPELNAVIHPRFEKALDEAASTLPAGPFAGVPMLLKDLGATQAGEPYCEGTGFAKAAGHRARRDSFVTEAFTRAGFLVLGRTNCPELGTAITTEPIAFGSTLNPWATTHSSGGSSGGSAAAVASGMVPLAHGNDGGGSIRIPSSCCGLFGLKPSRGRVSGGPAPTESWFGFSVNHVLTRSVRDSAAVLDVLSGYHPGDTFVAPEAAGSFSSQVGADPGRLRVAVLDHATSGDYRVDPQCAEAVRKAAAMLESLGHVVEPAYPPSLSEPETQPHFIVVVAAAVAAELGEWSEALGRPVGPEEYEPGNTLLAELGRATTAADFLGSVLWLEGFRRRTVSYWSESGFDLLLTPVLALPPARIGWLSDPVEGLNRTIETLRFTAQFNVSGQPAASLPLHVSDEGLPIGVQLVADYGREDLLIRIAGQLEEASGWLSCHPPLHG